LLERLRALAEQTAARVRVLILDACDSGTAARPKGGVLGPEYEVSLEKLPLEGTVVITSSGPAEPSQEWGSLGGSLFTHHLLTGLRGDADADGDGRVTLAEAYAYSYRRTVLEAVSSAQHPAFDLDLSGTGDLVLSEPGSARSALIFPADLEGRYVLASQPRPDVLAEVDKHSGRLLRLAVPPGRYILRKRMERTTGLLTLELPYGGETTVDETKMVHRSFAEVAVKGGRFELHPWSLIALCEVETAPFPSNWGRWHAGLAVRRTEGELWIQLAVLGGAARYRGEGITLSEGSLLLQLSGGYRWLLTPVIPYLGLSVQLEGYRQTFLRDYESFAVNVLGQGPVPPVLALGVSLGPVAGLEIPIWGPLFGWISVSGAVRYLRIEGGSPWSIGAQATTGAGWIF
jgi:hypothetical protein